jgi:hypothetical protein
VERDDGGAEIQVMCEMGILGSEEAKRSRRSFVDIESGTGPCCTPLTQRGGRQTSGNGLDNYDNMNCNLQYKN